MQVLNSSWMDEFCQPRKRRDLGINLGFNLAYNKNKVTKVSHYPESGAEYLILRCTKVTHSIHCFR